MNVRISSEFDSDLPPGVRRIYTEGGRVIYANFLVEVAEQPIAIIHVRSRFDAYTFKETALVWKNWVVAGAGEHVAFVNLETWASTATDLGCYFGYLYPAEACILAASAQRLYCFGPDARLQWTSEMLGVDGVVVHRIEADIISDSGEWDPPGSWKPFKLRLSTGAPLP